MKILDIFKKTTATKNDDDVSDSAVIAYPASWPSDLSTSHVTLLYLGSIAEANFTKDEVISTLAHVDLDMFFYVKTTGLDLFGPEKDIIVVRVDHPMLHSQREAVEAKLAAVGINNASEFKEYKPHITIRPEHKQYIPARVLLSPPYLYWGDEQIALRPTL